MARRQLLTSRLVCRLGLRHGGSNRFRGVQLWFHGSRRLRFDRGSKRQIAFLHVRGHKSFYEGARVLEIDVGAVAYEAMWGYGVDPPSDTGFSQVRALKSAAIGGDDTALGYRCALASLQINVRPVRAELGT